MKIKESLDQSKFPTRHLKDIGIEYIRRMQECINDDESFLKLLHELCDKSIWLSVTTKDLYYWIEILNKVDEIMEGTIERIKLIAQGNEKLTSVEFKTKMRSHIIVLGILLKFSNNLLKESGSRSIYNSVDRLMAIMKLVDDLDILFLCLETLYTLIKKSCLTGKYTRAHETEGNSLLNLIYMLCFGFNYLSSNRFNLANNLDLSLVTREKEIKIQRLTRIRRGNREVPALSYFRLSYDEIIKIQLQDGKQPTSRNLAKEIVEKNKMNPNVEDTLALRIFFGLSLIDKEAGENNLIKINKIMFKAKSIFIHLSAALEEDSYLTNNFILYHPFNSFIPELLTFCTIDAPSELHCIAIEIIHSYLSAAITNSETENIYRQSVNHIMSALGVVNMNSRPLHKILCDCVSLTVEFEEGEEVSAFDTGACTLKSNAKFIPSATAEDPNFVDLFLDLILMFVTNYKSTTRMIVNELLTILDAQPVNGYYIFRLSQVSKATRICYSIMKNNFEEFNTVERIIRRLSSEIDIIKERNKRGGTKLSEWKYAQSLNEEVHKSSRQELVRVLFRLLNSSIFKNDPNQGNFNPNFVSNSRKILDSQLFELCLDLFDENTQENSDTHDVIFVSAMHLMALVLNDLPAQISKACDKLLPRLFKSLEQRVPNYINFYLFLLKLVSAVSVHEKGKEFFKKSNLLEKILKVPIEPDYGFNFIN